MRLGKVVILDMILYLLCHNCVWHQFLFKEVLEKLSKLS